MHTFSWRCGGRAISCAPHTDVGLCLMGLQENQAAWTSYTNNMQQALSICVYVLHSNFRSSTEELMNFMYHNTAKISGGLQDLQLGMDSSITKVGHVHQELQRLAQAQGDIHRFAMVSLEIQSNFSKRQEELLTQSLEIKQHQKESKQDLNRMLQLQRQAFDHAQTQIATSLQSTKELTKAQQDSLSQSTHLMQQETAYLFQALNHLRTEHNEGQLEIKMAHTEAKQVLLDILNTSKHALAASNDVWEQQQRALSQAHGFLQLQQDNQKVILAQQENLGQLLWASSQDHQERAAELGKTLQTLTLKAEEASSKQKELLHQSGRVSEVQKQMQATMESLLKLQTHSSRAVSYLLGRSYGLEDVLWFVGICAGILFLPQKLTRTKMRAPLFAILLVNLVVERVVCPRLLPFLNHTLQLPFDFVLHDLKWYLRYVALCSHLALVVRKIIYGFTRDAATPAATANHANPQVHCEIEANPELLLAFQQFLLDRMQVQVQALPDTPCETPARSSLPLGKLRSIANTVPISVGQGQGNRGLFIPDDGCAMAVKTKVHLVPEDEVAPEPVKTPERRSERLQERRLKSDACSQQASFRPSMVCKPAKRSCPMEDTPLQHKRPCASDVDSISHL
mmetsp:Transcript_7142/g.44300  ORF Transcript_7142/g.44300 Transcript_7142/m.44300 type:complete len:624 (+) Transcript_7142:116-1987(+)